MNRKENTMKSNIIDNSYANVIVLPNGLFLRILVYFIIQYILNVDLPLQLFFLSFISVPESTIHESFVCNRSGTIISAELVFPTSIT